MSDYQCYFDASHMPLLSGSTGCAFFVMADGQHIYSHTHHGKFEGAPGAEMHALYLLLQYIQWNMEPGKDIEIFGDALNVVNAITRNRKKRKSKNRIRGEREVRTLYRALSRHHTLTLTHIPREKNKVAHWLSKHAFLLPLPPSLPASVPSLSAIISGRRKNSVSLGFITLYLRDIKVPYSFSPPSEKKYCEKLEYFERHGQVQSQIQISPNGMLLDGYISYLILQEHGIPTCRVEVLGQKETTGDVQKTEPLSRTV
jgi:ribonuclease HI